MSDRAETRDSVARAEEAEAPIDEDLEEVLEDALDEASRQEVGELEEVVEAVLAVEEEEDNRRPGR